MQQALAHEERRILENQVADARAEAEAGAEKAVNALPVGAKESPAHLAEDQKRLRVRLGAHGRALGDLLRPDDTQAITD